jgi:hypothetical protein
MTEKRKIVHRIQCAHNEEHIFDKAFEIKDGPVTKETEIQTYCPFCDKSVTVRIKGEVLADKEVLRTYGLL